MNAYVTGYLAVMQVGLGADAANDGRAVRGTLDDRLSRFGHRLVSAGYRVGSVGVRLARRVRRWRRERRAVRELERLDDRTLRDIGLLRADIRSVVRGLDRGVTQRRLQGVAAAGAPRRAAANDSVAGTSRRKGAA